MVLFWSLSGGLFLASVIGLQLVMGSVMGIHSKSEKVCGTAFSVKKKLRKKCINPGVNVSRQMRVNLAFKILRQKVRKSPRQYFATKVRKLRFQILKTEHTAPKGSILVKIYQ